MGERKLDKIECQGVFSQNQGAVSFDGILRPCDTLDGVIFYLGISRMAGQEKKWPVHYGLKLTVSKFSNFPLLNPSQIAPKFYSLVELCRAKNSTWVEADSI